MKTALQILTFLFFVQSCQSQELDIKYETFEINIPGQPGPWLKQNGKFYCFFRTDNDKFSSSSKHQFYILNKEGNIESKISVPEELQTFYYDLYIQNDSIFTTEYYDNNTFYLDEENKQWVETKKGIDLFYKDENYEVYSLDFGEWGGTTWFKNSKTKKQYEFAGSSPIINKLDNSYYVTLGNKVLKISDPQKMELSNKPYEYNKALFDKNYFKNGSNSFKGTEIIYEYKNDDYFNPKFYFATSFVSSNRLFNIYKDGLSTKIGIIENKDLIPKYEFQNKIYPSSWDYDRRNSIQNNKFQTLQFSTEKNNEYGIIEINRNNLLVTTFKNSYIEKELGEAKTKDWVEKTFTYYLDNFDKLYLKDIDFVELKENPIDLTQSHKMSHYLLDGKEIETPRIYRKLENSIFKLNTMYYYDTNDKSIQLIEFEWGKNKNSFENNVDFSVLESANKDKSVYEPKFIWLSKFLNSKLGKPNKSNIGDKSGNHEWIIESKVIKLQYNENLCELTMYKK